MLFALSRVFVADDWDKVLRSESKCRGQHALSGLHGLRAKHFIMFKNRIMGLLQEKKMHLNVIYLHPEVAELKSAK